MPYKSAAQRGWAHTPAGTKALGGASKVHEWDTESKGKDLPAKVGGTGPAPKGIQSMFHKKAKGTLSNA